MHLRLLAATVGAAQSEDRTTKQKTTFLDSIDPTRTLTINFAAMHSSALIRSVGRSEVVELKHAVRFNGN
jgi:hypothetical protein